MRKINSSIISIIILLVMLISFSGCSQEKSSEFDKTKDITVITRESGSGTRGAFIELFGIEQKDENGKKVDLTIANAITNDKTGIVLTGVSQDKNAIGYISLGSLNDSVKALEIDGAKATTENVKNGSYKISRPFNIATRSDLSDVGKDFINFILSSDGQKIVLENGYIAASENKEYSGETPSGSLKISGSSSVTPVMEKLKEAYLKINTAAKIEINLTDSTSGITAVTEKTSDIGMASREVKQSEIDKGLNVNVIAIDGIAVIVNNNNPLIGLKADNIKDIYIGKTIKWDDISSGAIWG